MGPQTTATTVGLFPLAAIPPQTSRALLVVQNEMETALEVPLFLKNKLPMLGNKLPK